ncbi:MAG: A24 family peptidase [Phycisphaeraceae bacterium]|nr:A24 family peptidase [Phycisphaeraceae bacterium]
MDYRLLMAFATGTQLLFVFAFGACIGSLINVLVYRLPRGLGVVTPPSRCPACNTRLTWRENIPILGWIILKGRCRTCRVRISPEYPIVESIVALLFLAVFVLWYTVPTYRAMWLGFDWAVVRPEWAANGFARTWPMFVLLMALLSCLVAMTIVDARTFTIPLVLAWVPTIAAFVIHPLHALWLDLSDRSLSHLAAGWSWAIASPGPTGWLWVGVAVGGGAGVLVANALLAWGLIRRSFADYEAWESAERAKASPGTIRSGAEQGEACDTSETAGVSETSTPPKNGCLARGAVVAVGGTLLAAVAGGIIARVVGRPPIAGGLFGLILGPIIAGFIARPLTRSAADDSETEAAEDPTALWIAYPHARREVTRELLFLGPIVALALVGAAVGLRLSNSGALPTTVPLWLDALSGVLLGYLVGGGMIWATRVLGTLAFGKEAMGLGDVHLLAAVGACLGWIDAILTFFIAPFIAIYFAAILAAWTGSPRRAMPYGPYLAGAVLVVTLAKPAIEAGLTRVFGLAVPLDIP